MTSLSSVSLWTKCRSVWDLCRCRVKLREYSGTAGLIEDDVFTDTGHGSLNTPKTGHTWTPPSPPTDTPFKGQKKWVNRKVICTADEQVQVSAHTPHICIQYKHTMRRAEQHITQSFCIFVNRPKCFFSFGGFHQLLLLYNVVILFSCKTEANLFV